MSNTGYLMYPSLETTMVSTGTLAAAIDIPSAENACNTDVTCLAFDSTFKKYQFVEAPASFTAATTDLYIKDTSTIDLLYNGTYVLPPTFNPGATGSRDNLQSNNILEIYSGCWVLLRSGSSYVSVNSLGQLISGHTRTGATPFLLSLLIFQSGPNPDYCTLQSYSTIGGVKTLVNVYAANDGISMVMLDINGTGQPLAQILYNTTGPVPIAMTNIYWSSNTGLYLNSSQGATATTVDIIVQSTALRESDYINSSSYQVGCCTSTINVTSVAATCANNSFTPSSSACANTLNTYCQGSNLLSSACQTYCETQGVNCDSAFISYCDPNTNSAALTTASCACFLGSSFYQTYLTALRTQLPGISQAITSSIPVCIYPPCATSQQLPFLYRSGQETCPNNTVAVCIQNETVNNDGSITGNVQLSSSAACQALTNPANSTVTSTGTGTGTSTGTSTSTATGTSTASSDSTTLIIIGVIAGSVLLIFIIYSFVKKKPAVSAPASATATNATR